MTFTTAIILPVEVLDATYLAADTMSDVSTVTGLYVRAWHYAAVHHTDGHVPAHWLAECGVPKPSRFAKAFVKARLWEDTPDGWRIVAFTLCNPTVTEAAKADRLREQARRRQQSRRDRLFGNDRDIVTTAERDIVTKKEGLYVRTDLSTSTDLSDLRTSPAKTSRCHGDPLIGLHVFELWRQHRGPLPSFKALSPTRKKLARALAKRLNEHAQQTDADPAALLESIIKTIGLNPWMCGQNDTGWKADIDYLLKPDTWVKAVEGKLDRRQGPRTADGARKAVRDANVAHVAQGDACVVDVTQDAPLSAAEQAALDASIARLSGKRQGVH